MEYEKAYITFRCKYLMKLSMKVSKTMSFGRFFSPKGREQDKMVRGMSKYLLGILLLAAWERSFPAPEVRNEHFRPSLSSPLSLKELAIYMYLYTQYLFWLNKFQNNVLYTFFIMINV